MCLFFPTEKDEKVPCCMWMPRDDEVSVPTVTQMLEARGTKDLVSSFPASTSWTQPLVGGHAKWDISQFENHVLDAPLQQSIFMSSWYQYQCPLLQQKLIPRNSSWRAQWNQKAGRKVGGLES